MPSYFAKVRITSISAASPNTMAFKDPDRSGLAYTLKSGEQRIDLDLRP
jgi:hypothetical protein